MNSGKNQSLKNKQYIFDEQCFSTDYRCITCMDEEIKVLARQLVKKVDSKIRRELKAHFITIGRTIDIGADGTPTKLIDKLAEDVAIKTIKKSKTKINLLSEEAGFIDNDAEYTFVLDPVDGTRNATRGIPFFTVSLAVGRHSLSDVEYGIIKHVSTGDIYEAEAKMGAFYNKNHILVPDVSSQESVYSATLGKRCEAKTHDMVKNAIVRSLGSASLEMCLVATGALDAYIVSREFLRVTDIAASTLFLREAGGIVADISGESLDMTLTLDERTSVLAAGNRELIQQLTTQG
ncbi:MAG: inositol monophosphatase family protein [Thermoplasmatota archaeon]